MDFIKINFQSTIKKIPFKNNFHSQLNEIVTSFNIDNDVIVNTLYEMYYLITDHDDNQRIYINSQEEYDIYSQNLDSSTGKRRKIYFSIGNSNKTISKTSQSNQYNHSHNHVQLNKSLHNTKYNSCLTMANEGNMIIIKEVKSFQVYIKALNNGNSHWKTGFELGCKDKSQVKGEDVRLNIKVDVGKNVNVEIQVNTFGLGKGKYYSYWQMRDFDRIFFGEELMIEINIV